MKKNKFRIFVSILVAAVFSMACGFTGLLSDVLDDEGFYREEESVVVEQVEPGVEDEAAPPQTQPIVVDAIPAGLADLYESVVPGVVYIQVYAAGGSGSGSGFVYDMDGHIVTNYHVVDGAELIEVHFYSGLKVYGEVIATDTDSDLAVLKVDVPASELYPLTMGSSTDLRVGDGVVAIGNPYGLVGTITYGIVSAKGRTMESLRLAESGSYFSTGDIIQTDASINPGNSGGPLLNLAGEVIGVNRAIQTSGVSVMGDPINTGIGFAISVDIVNRVVPILIETGDYEYPYIGVSSIESLSLLQQELLGIEQNTGAYVTSVVAGSPADEAGLIGGQNQVVDYDGQSVNMPVGGDLIIKIDDVDVGVFGDLLSYILLNKAPGDTVMLTIVRNGEILEVPLTLGSRAAVQ
ncbi:MAG: trypsin-like peptidase domain-containing protein [Anaerolineae bacterium]|jgi:2-alkenal reductase|nr:trypsin-like peptidase domain-containing protein [Anaerolineae bacterium]